MSSPLTQDPTPLQENQSRRKLNQYARIMNPTFQSQLINMVMVQPSGQDSNNRRRKFHEQTQPTNYLDQLDLATREYEKRRMSVQDPQKHYGPVAVTTSLVGQPSRPAERQPQSSPQQERLAPRSVLFEVLPVETTKPHAMEKQRSKSTRLLPMYSPNDEGVFVKQYKPYNIITNNPHQITPLRVHPKLSTEFKRHTHFENYLQHF